MKFLHASICIVYLSSTWGPERQVGNLSVGGFTLVNFRRPHKSLIPALPQAPNEHVVEISKPQTTAASCSMSRPPAKGLHDIKGFAFSSCHVIFIYAVYYDMSLCPYRSFIYISSPPILH